MAHGPLVHLLGVTGNTFKGLEDTDLSLTAYTDKMGDVEGSEVRASQRSFHPRGYSKTQQMTEIQSLSQEIITVQPVGTV